MKWVEIITLRSLARANQQLVEELLQQVFEQKQLGLPALIRIYHHGTVETDFSIHIHWEIEGQLPCESPLGLQISYALRGLGFLNHSIWIETACLE
ncbi:MAG: hypothetical protein LLG06_19955 [Desulfobacteraceae bacterium]|nr:hypothetical protein [Desulfobacteraceae bacterium]